MTDKEKIRAEVERLKMEYDKESIFRTVRGDTAREVFGKLLSFIDSIPEESSEDLEEYYKKQFLPKEWFAKPGHRTISQFNFFTAQHFAEYGRNHFEDKSEMVSEDLEEEMIRWHKEHFGNKRDWEKTSGEYLTRKSQLDLARHFAEWQKQQMMEDAVEGLVGGHTDIPAFINLEIGHKPNVKVGDKVKIIILKTE